MKILVNGTPFVVDLETVKSQLAEGIENPQIEITSESHVLRSTDDENAFIENMKRDARVEGLEIAIKNARNTLGLSFEGKTIDNLVKAVQDKAINDANIDPDKKVAEALKDVEILKGTISTIEKQRDEAVNGLSSYKKGQTIQSTLFELIPDNVAIPKNDMLTIIQSKYKIDLNENDQVVFSDANGLMKNTTTLNPLTPKEVINSFFQENTAYVKSASGGAGGGDSGGGTGKKSIDSFNKEMADKGYSVGSQEYVTQMEKEITANTLDISPL